LVWCSFSKFADYGLRAYGYQRISENQQISGTWTPSFYGYDGHGNVRFLANTAPSITDGYDFDAFGMPIRSSGTTPNQFLYSGERYDSSIGLYDLRARYLNQATGRFWTRDSVEGKKCCGLSWNPYIYVNQNAVNFVDPSGREGIVSFNLTLQKVTAAALLVSIPLGFVINEAYLCVAEKQESVNAHLTNSWPSSFPPPPSAFAPPTSTISAPPRPPSPTIGPPYEDKCFIEFHDETPANIPEGDPRGPLRFPGGPDRPINDGE
jgi:RHS repeat-associated protein